MTNLEMGFWSFPVLLLMIFLRAPIGLAMIVCGLGGWYFATGEQLAPLLAKLKSEPYTQFSKYSYSVVPLFLLMGQFASLSGMSLSLFKAAESFLGHRRGGVAMAAVGACAGFGAVCGSSLATAATMSKVALPELKRYGYSGGLSTATLAAGGTLGILIPPSVILVIYAAITEQNIESLFLAALIPGILAAVGYIVTISIYVRLYPETAQTRPAVPMKQRLKALRDTWAVFVVFLVVVGGIYRGWFTPTEGAAIGAAGTGLLAFMAGSLSWRVLVEALFGTARTTAMIYFIILGAGFYNSFLALSGVPQFMADWVLGQGLNPWLVLALILVFYLIFGCLMDSLSMILLTVPIFFPVISAMDFGLVDLVTMQHEAARAALASGADISAASLEQLNTALANGQEIGRELQKELGFRIRQIHADRLAQEYTAIWFGILVLIVVEVGLITPPVGMNLFIINSMDRETRISETYRAVMWFVGSDIVRVIILVAFPMITLCLVKWFGG